MPSILNDYLQNIITKIAEDDSDMKTYSATLRYLRLNYPNQVKSFLIDFKKAFDIAVTENLEDLEAICLTEAKQNLKLDK